MTYLDIDNLDHDPELAAALGNMVVAWARAETAITGLYAATMGVHYNTAAAAYYNIPTFESRIRVLKALIRDKQEPFPRRHEAQEAVEKLAKLAGTRNQWVHGLWTTVNDTDETVYFNMKSDPDGRTAIPVKAADVTNHVNAVRIRTAALEALLPLVIARRT